VIPSLPSSSPLGEVSAKPTEGNGKNSTRGLSPPALRATSPAGEDKVASVSVSGSLNNTPTTWLVPEEVPVAILLNSTSYAVMMATPADLEDFALGFVLSENIVAHHSHVKGILLLKQEEGYSVDVAIAEEHLLRDAYVKRTMEGRVGCGLCGVAELTDALRMPREKVPAVKLKSDAVIKAFDALPAYQPMNAANHTVHAAAFVTSAGDILPAREDVGRHNALDKLIGAMARKAQVPDDGFVLMSSRCSSELVQKCARVSLGALATMSAPTAFALQLAKQAGITLAARAPEGVMMFGA